MKNLCTERDDQNFYKKIQKSFQYLYPIKCSSPLYSSGKSIESILILILYLGLELLGYLESLKAVLYNNMLISTYTA